MKWLPAILLPLLLGFALGRSSLYQGRDHPVSSDDDPVAITFRGLGSTEFKSVPKGGQYSRGALLDMLVKAQDHGDDSLLRAIGREWALMEDGSGIDSLIDAGERDSALRILREWSRLDPAAAAAKASAITPKSARERRLRDEVLSGGIIELITSDPENVPTTGWVDQLSGGSHDPPDASGLYEMDETQLENALQAIATFSDPWKLESFAAQFLGQLAVKQPEAALDWVETHIGSANRTYHRVEVFDRIASERPDDALRILESMLDDPSVAASCVPSLISNLSAKDPDRLKAWFRERETKVLESLRSHLTDGRFDYGSDQNWNTLAADLGPGFEWMEIPQEPDLPRVEWPITHIEEARSFMKRDVPDDPFANRNHPEWTIESMNETVRILQGADEFASPDAEAIAKKWASFDPRTAFEWAAGLEPKLRIGASEAALGTWFANEPVKALAYVDSLPDSEFRRYAVERVATDWLKSSPEPAAKWINKMPQGVDRDIGKREIAATFRQRNPQRAFMNANAISDPVIRDEALEQVFEIWFRIDAAAAAESLGKAKISAERQSEMMHQVAK